MNIYLARHGQNEDNANGILNGHRDLPLTEVGIDQARIVAKLIKESNLKFDHVYTSPLIRASKTAEIISTESNNPKPITHPMLIERDFGVMSGIKADKIEELCAPRIIKTETITYFLNSKGAETFPDLIKRAKELLTEMENRHPNENILLVGHGDMGKMIYAAYYDLDWEYILRAFHFGNSELLLLSKDSSPTDAHVFSLEQYNH